MRWSPHILQMDQLRRPHLQFVYNCFIIFINSMTNSCFNPVSKNYLDGVLGIWTQGWRMEAADDSIRTRYNRLPKSLRVKVSNLEALNIYLKPVSHILHASSVTRFSNISTLLQNFTSLWHFVWVFKYMAKFRTSLAYLYAFG